ncbi:vertnin [Electrophorus electricus]|uniref:Vertnin n=1 Tax=Electrophorus electricus TaxID=8005 RepID=A0A4W4FM74_ELEEL|nr:vertnin [Electrophorus electricus]
MIQRNEVVLAVLGELQEATESQGLNALIKVALEVEQVLAPFHLPSALCTEISFWMGIDGVAHRLYPADAPADLLPLVCKGKGNLLFDAASMLLVGSTSLSLELQVRAVVEMLLWKRYYLNGMIDSKVMLQAARFSLCAEESQDMLKLPMQVLEAIFDADVKASCFPGSFANMWHVYALSSVLQCNIYSIYPMYNLKIRPYFNRLIRPRTWHKDTEPLTLHIMWSGELEAGSIFKPHNFVALIPASDLKIGSPYSEQHLPPGKSLELLGQDLQLSYSTLKDKFNITKSTFYRWRRQSTEYHKKSVARYEAKHFFQTCYKEGKLIPQNQFREFFPEISRSTYYAWKHELMSTGSIVSVGSNEELSPGESIDHDCWTSPEIKKHPIQETFNSMLALKSEKPEGDRAQNAALMQEAKKSLQICIATNTSFPYRIFKRRFPGISRSTYYNWRREAMLFTPFRDLSGSGEECLDADKVQYPKEKSSIASLGGRRLATRVKIARRSHESLRLLYLQKKRLREEAKACVQKSKMSLFKFKLKFPSISSCYYWLWRYSLNKKAQKESSLSLESGEPKRLDITEDALQHVRGSQVLFASDGNMDCLNGKTKSPTKFSLPENPLCDKTNDEQMFVMDVVALANFKAKAKLFLQQRFEEKSFPTFKEFRSYFPLTPRSTYYMWKRALHHGVPLVHGQVA